MMGGLRLSMAWLHTWSGLLVGWILFMVFAGGTASYFRDEITLWMKPELHRTLPHPVTQAVAADRAQALLEQRAAGSPRWFFSMPGERNPALQAGWIPAPPKVKGDAAKGDAPKKRTRRSFGSATIDPATGEDLGKVRETRGGDFFFRLHFDLHYMSALWGRWIVGFCGMCMLVAILSGIVTHKRIFKDFFTFRPGKGQRSWLDAHNVTAVLALPYHLMITYTGLVTLMFMYLPSGVQSVYQDRTATFYKELNGGPGDVKPAGVPATLMPIGALVEQASGIWHGAAVGRVVVNLPGDANATVTLTQQEGHGISYDLPTMTFNGVTGALLSDPSKTSGSAVQTRGVMYGLHVGRFADPLVRALFFLSGLAGCAMVATGVIMWAVKERPKHAKMLGPGRVGFSLRLVDALNLGSIAGLLIAMPVFFWANRLLPVAMPQRPEAEILWFFTAWGIAALAAFAMPNRPMWKFQLALGGILFALLPVLNAATGGAGLLTSLGQGIWPIAGFDLVSLALGVMLLYAAAKLRSVPAVKKVQLAGGAA
jgi:uncharacterized iron-regulated membrane protein